MIEVKSAETNKEVQLSTTCLSEQELILGPVCIAFKLLGVCPTEENLGRIANNEEYAKQISNATSTIEMVNEAIKIAKTIDFPQYPFYAKYNDTVIQITGCKTQESDNDAIYTANVLEIGNALEIHKGDFSRIVGF